MLDGLVHKVMAESRENLSRLAEIIQDYNPTLRLREIPRKMRETDDEKNQPYVIVQMRDGNPILVMYLTEAEVANPPGVLARLFNSDNSKHGKGGVLARIEASENAQRVWESKKAVEEKDAALDFWKQLMRTNKHTWKHDGVKFDTDTHNAV